MKKNNLADNYLERIPMPCENLKWEHGENGEIVLLVNNTGIANRIAQKIFKKPEITYIHLDNLGSFVWRGMGPERSIFELGKMVNKHFGDEAEPLYERLAEFFSILEKNKFIKWYE